MIFDLGQLRRAVLEVLPFLFNFLGERFDAQCLDQNLDPRLVLVVAPAVAVVHPQHRFDVGQQMLPRQALANLQTEDRRAPQTAADDHPQEHLPVVIGVKIKADVMHHDRRAVLLRRADGDLEFARQEQEFRVDGRPLPQDFGQRARVDHFVRRDPGERFGGDVAHAVAGGLDRMHFDLRPGVRGCPAPRASSIQLNCMFCRVVKWP